MGILKKNRVISELEAWRVHAGPKSPIHWADGRSAKEAARSWLETQPDRMPKMVADSLKAHPEFQSIDSWVAEPEARLRFDDLPGEPRNSDLAVYCDNVDGGFLIAVEAKADEPYGETVSSVFASALERKLVNPRSNGILRIEQLAVALFDARPRRAPGIGGLRYQLLTACAGALCEAERRRYPKVLLLIQQFITDQTEDHNHIRNDKDLNRFVARLSSLEVDAVDAGTIYGPFTVPGTPLLSNVPKLFIGKVSTNLRASASGA